jgi:hypothetical protein
MYSRLRPSPAMVVALIALFVSLGGTAAALSGSNTVFTDDVANDTQPAGGGNPAGGLVAADLRPSSVGTSEVAADSLGAGDLAPSSVGTSEVADNSLGGTDILESSLGTVTHAAVGGYGRTTSGGCAPGSAFVDCVILTPYLPARSRVLLIGEANARTFAGDGAGECKLVTQFGDVSNTLVAFSLHDGDVVPGALVGITGPFGPGFVDFGIDCRVTGGSLAYSPDHLAAIAISPD